MKINKKTIVLIIAMAFLAVAIYNCIIYAESYHKALISNNIEPYFYINEHPVTKLEYDFYFKKYYKDYVSEFSDLFDYMGVDSEIDLLQQKYDDENTFGEYFDKCTKETMCKIYALKADGLSKGFVYDADKEYQEMIETLINNESLNNLSIRQYFKEEFGHFANEINLKPFYEDFFYAIKYNEYLYDTMGGNEETDRMVFDYIEGLKKEYEVFSK